MKIIDPGTKPSEKLAWWTEIELACTCCGCRFQLEPGDEKRADVEIVQARCLDCPGTIRAVCPTCGMMVQHTSRPSERSRALPDPPRNLKLHSRGA